MVTSFFIQKGKTNKQTKTPPPNTPCRFRNLRTYGLSLYREGLSSPVHVLCSAPLPNFSVTVLPGPKQHFPSPQSLGVDGNCTHVPAELFSWRPQRPYTTCHFVFWVFHCFLCRSSHPVKLHFEGTRSPEPHLSMSILNGHCTGFLYRQLVQGLDPNFLGPVTSSSLDYIFVLRKQPLAGCQCPSSVRKRAGKSSSSLCLIRI